jgi:hypothetical protein
MANITTLVLYNNQKMLKKEKNDSYVKEKLYF